MRVQAYRNGRKVYDVPSTTVVKIKRLPTKTAYGAHYFRNRGGVCGPTTSTNGIGIVPAAFIKGDY